MAQTWDVHEAEKKTFRVAIFEDGLWDIYVGVVLLIMSLYGVMRSVWKPTTAALVILSVLIVFALAYRLIKRRLQSTRAGKVEFSARSKTKLGAVKIVMIVLVLFSAAFAFAFMTGSIPLPSWFPALGVDILFAVALSGIFFLMGAFFGISRLYAYGILFGLALVSTPLMEGWFDLELNLGFTIAGLIVLSAGIFIFRQFWQSTKALNV